jgi:hypothetical protein
VEEEEEEGRAQCKDTLENLGPVLQMATLILALSPGLF